MYEIERSSRSSARPPHSSAFAIPRSLAAGPTISRVPVLAVEAPLFSIQVPSQPAHLLCGICQNRFLAAGPTGHRDDEPICDLCMLEGDAQLGMVLALVAVTRSYGAGWPRDAVEEDHARLELMAFARIFEIHAAKYAPARPIYPEWLWKPVE